MNDYKRRYKDRNSSGIRNRQVARNRRKQFIAQIKISSISKIRDMPLFTEANKILQKPWMMLHDIVWMFVTQLPVFKIISLIVLFVTMVILGSYLFTDTILYRFGFSTHDFTAASDDTVTATCFIVLLLGCDYY